jgi:pyruvate dehydrogenase E1 component alpha subunit
MLAKRLQEVSAVGEQNLQRTTAGCEAMLVGVLAHAKGEDSITMAENAFLAGVLRGDPLNSLLAQLISSVSNAGPRNEKVSPALLALTRGMGQAKEMLDGERVALVFCGEDPTALTFQNEALALAAKYKAPVVCVIQIAFSSLAAAEGQRRSRSKKAPQPGFPEIVVEGADVVAIFRVAQEAVRRARTGHGPSLIKCVMPNDGSAKSQAVSGSTHDPLVLMEHYLRRRNLWSEDWQRKIADDFTAELDATLASMEEPSPAKSG